MGLQMITGASGTGKSDYIYRLINEQAKANRKKKFFILVPDQFTMQTQADMVNIAGGGIMNIDVLSFSRLAHRIFEETNCEKKMVLDDTGKSLILRRLAVDMKDKLPYLSGNLKRNGFIHEVKSSISEFMQYRIGIDELDKLIMYSEGKGALRAKLTDLRLLYEGFIEYIGDRYITTEESMDLLALKLEESELIKGSVVVLDGFTGFTPVQMRVVSTLMRLCETVYITLTLEHSKMDGKDGLFALTQKSYDSIMRTAHEGNISIEKEYICDINYRFKGKPDLNHLERNIFRYPLIKYNDVPENLELYEAFDIQDEVKNLAESIMKLVRNGAQYREIAVITGSIESYENHILRVFRGYSIPLYVDKTRAIVLNPFVEYTKSLLRLLDRNFDRESVIRYLRTGMVDVDIEDVDVFENYCIKTGMRGKKAYISYIPDENADVAERINGVREKIICSVMPMLDVNVGGNGKLKAEEYVKALYECYETNGVFGKITEYEKAFREEDNFTKEKEYSQIYRLTMELLEQIYGLLGKEEISLGDFIDIIEAGFEEITVGTIPQSVDKVIVGDMERSRLKPVKYLFFLGLNDGYVPKKSSKCSILSDMEREYLAENDLNLELAPTPRQKMFIQRFYMYSNLVKPSEKLFMSYSAIDNEGRSLRQAYIIPMICNMFDKMEHKIGEAEDSLENIGNIIYLKEYICELIRQYGEHDLNENKKNKLMKSIELFLSLGEAGSEALLDMFIANSFYHNEDKRLESEIAGILYGERLLASISRMEQFAVCAYAYFLRYGLSLKEKEKYELDDRDMGSIFHKALEKYGNTISKMGISWTEISPEEAERILDKALEESVIESGSILYEGKTNNYILRRMGKVLNKAVDVLTYQLKAGEYKVSELEVSFRRVETLDEINVALDKQEKMELNGRIDRIDTLEKNNKVYVKVIDYKTGNKDFSLLNFYYGLQLQLVVYMTEGMKKTAEKHKGKTIEPGALLYYRVADNVVDAKNEVDEEKINKLIRESLKTKGLINDDDTNVMGLTGITQGKSDVVKIGFNKNGSYSSDSSVISAENLRLLGEYADFKLRNIGNEIIAGKKSRNPIKEDENKNSCTYCAYKKICGFDERLDGFDMIHIKKMSDDELMEKMKRDMEAELDG